MKIVGCDAIPPAPQAVTGRMVATVRNLSLPHPQAAFEGHIVDVAFSFKF